MPLELPAGFLPTVVAEVSTTTSDVLVEVRHASTMSQWDALRSGELDLGLVRELRSGGDFDSVLVIEERLGIVLLAKRAAGLVGPEGSIPLHRLRGMAWNGFSRSDASSSYDSIAATLKATASGCPTPTTGDHAPSRRRVAEVADGTKFALALPDFPLHPGMEWRRLTRDPLIRRTWAVRRAEETSPSIAAVVDAMELKRRVADT